MPNEMNNILTLENDAAVETQKSKEDLIWHEITNAYRTRRILTGMLGGIEKLEGGATITIVYYKNFRVVIPITEMMINLVEDETHNYGELSLRQNKIVNTMLGCEIDFIIKGLDSKERSIVASRKDAMLKKRQIFYFDQDSSGTPKVYPDRVVQARVISVAENVGDHILVRIQEVKAEDPEHISVRADVKSVEGDTSKANLALCKVQGKYAGTVEDIHNGTVFVRLQIGVNAIAHTCYDSRTVGKKDDVSFVVTHIDSERNVALGIITRIIRQNL